MCIYILLWNVHVYTGYATKRLFCILSTSGFSNSLIYGMWKNNTLYKKYTNYAYTEWNTTYTTARMIWKNIPTAGATTICKEILISQSNVIKPNTEILANVKFWYYSAHFALNNCYIAKNFAVKMNYCITLWIRPVLFSPYEVLNLICPVLKFANSPIFLNNPLHIIQFAQF